MSYTFGSQLGKFALNSALVGLLAFTISCGGKKKADEAAGGGEPDGAIVAKDMDFNAEGSDSGKIDGLKTVTFPYDQSTLTGEAQETLKNNAAWMKSRPNVVVQVEGHCDSRGSIEYNLALGERRAKSVKNYLVGLGIDGKRLTVLSYGEEKPVAQGDTEEAYARNRRANFVPLAQ